MLYLQHVPKDTHQKQEIDADPVQTAHTVIDVNMNVPVQFLKCI